MEEYFLAKRRLFDDLAPVARVVNADDPYGRRLAQELPGTVTYGMDAPADYRATDVAVALTGSSFLMRTPSGESRVECPLPGRFNVANVLAAVAGCAALGVPTDALVPALAALPRVPGRFEPVAAGQEFAVLVDYAHTPDSLENVLRAARDVADGRLITVFGCGGDRDRDKRPQMGAIAGRLSDIAIATSDNPRSEDPEAILDEVLAGAPANVERVLDRAQAIAAAIERASRGDVVVIAGKGHERGQEFADGRKQPFDDVEVARRVLSARRLDATRSEAVPGS
jgi:UDP-N-acetylmuramoyl-L-alanyl-D-glutamate--2,6-diaminopimelate ligase